MSEINDRTRKNLEGNAELIFDKAAASENAKEAKEFAEAGKIVIDAMTQLQNADVKESEQELEERKQDDQVSFWDRQYSVSPKVIFDGFCGILKSAAAGLGVLGTGYIAYKGVQSQNQTTLKCVDAVTDYKESNLLDTKSLELVDKAQKVGK